MSSLSPLHIIDNKEIVCPNAPKKNTVNYFDYKYSNINIINTNKPRRLSIDDIHPTINEDIEPPPKKLCK
jgi:hypothetical protein